MGGKHIKSGESFGNLTTIEWDPHLKKWKCLCKCGTYSYICSSHLRSGHTKSCGCLRSQKGADCKTYKHGFTPEDRLYRIWNNMRGRCLCKSAPNYSKYGAKGIGICDEWNEFLIFRTWALENGYSDDLTLDRVDNSRGYSPLNCRWVDMSTQGRNRSSNRMIAYNGETRCLTEWAEIYGIPAKRLHHRITYAGWSFEKAITTPLRIVNKRDKNV